MRGRWTIMLALSSPMYPMARALVAGRLRAGGAVRLRLGQRSSGAKAALATTARPAAPGPIDPLAPAAAAAQRRNGDPGAVFVVTGAARGLGIEFCAQLLERTRGTVVACSRGGAEGVPPALAAMAAAAAPGRLVPMHLDVASQLSVDQFAADLAGTAGGNSSSGVSLLQVALVCLKRAPGVCVCVVVVTPQRAASRGWTFC
jgi:hypothetical protein